ncbi:DegT/DnrJ/EryC1/StrS family aminotransferase [Dongia deserti]|uniref:DegT/DnrJ/EryC1/StrS family aminotransferase n=1 Tax=Dongia deserti TaxID=2268030 RepID=UPI00254920BC|nr:DegT/DnrJ/EryC1/StrS family aminotransferase [Dongia deserti]
MNDLKRLYTAYQADIETAALAAMRSGWWLNGGCAKSFCASFARACGASECIPVANGTDALEIALRAVATARSPAGREVITVANAGGYTTVACRQSQLVPVYADVEERSQLLAIESAVAALSDQTLAIVATHLYGGVVDVPVLRRMLREAGYGHVAIVEDCAQAHGARSGDAPVGSLGDIAAFSFYPTKNLGAMGDAGAIVTSDAVLADIVRKLRQYGWSAKYHVDLGGGRNSRMDEVQAAILQTMLPRLGALNAERARIRSRLSEAAGDSLEFVDGGPGAVVHLAVVRSPTRDALRRFLVERGVESEIHYPVLDCDQLGWEHLPMRIAPGGLPIARRSVGEILTLPCFPGMTKHELTALCTALEEWRQ